MLTTTVSPPQRVYVRRQPELMGELGIDFPGTESMLNVGKAIYYAGVGSALIVASLFVWRIVDTVFGD